MDTRTRTGEFIRFQDMTIGQSVWIVPWIIRYNGTEFKLWDDDEGSEKPVFDTANVKVARVSDNRFTAEIHPNGSYSAADILRQINTEGDHPYRNYFDLTISIYVDAPRPPDAKIIRSFVIALTTVIIYSRWLGIKTYERSGWAIKDRGWFRTMTPAGISFLAGIMVESKYKRKLFKTRSGK